MPFFDDKLPGGEFDFRQFAKTIANQEDIAKRARLAAGRAVRFRAVTLGLERAERVDTSETDRLIDAGIEAARILAVTPGVPLSEYQTAALEAVVRTTERPALIIKDDIFAEPPLRWERLDVPHREEIQKLIPAAGRIESTSGGKSEMIGTGFVVASDLVMTNTHVVEEFADPAPDDYSTWSIRPGANPIIDFKAEHESQRRKAFRIKEVVLAFERENSERLKSLDLALLKVETMSFDPVGEKLPEPVKLAATEPTRLFAGDQSADGSSDIYLVGYPWTDNEGATPPEILEDIFGGILKMKRLQPGEYRTNFPDHLAFSHDSATLGGNSGSFVADLSSALIVGLHFKGKYKQANYALQLWKLRDLPFMRGRGLNFTD